MNDQDYDDMDYEDDAPRRGNKVKKFKHRDGNGDRDFKRERDRQRAEKSRRQAGD